MIVDDPEGKQAELCYKRVDERTLDFWARHVNIVPDDTCIHHLSSNAAASC